MTGDLGTLAVESPLMVSPILEVVILCAWVNNLGTTNPAKC